MKRERRVLAIAGDERVVVGVLYRGKLWFESLEVKVLDKKGGCEVFKSRYLDQARTILIDEELLRCLKINIEEDFLALIPKRGGVEVIIIGEEGASISREKIKKLCVQGDVPEALRVARRIFNEIRNIIGETI